MTAAEFNIEARWPELFVNLDERQRRAVIDTLASSWHEGWIPNREHVENLTDYTRGAIDRDEYRRRVMRAADPAVSRGRELPEWNFSDEPAENLPDDDPEVTAGMKRLSLLRSAEEHGTHGKEWGSPR